MPDELPGVSLCRKALANLERLQDVLFFCFVGRFFPNYWLFQLGLSMLLPDRQLYLLPLVLFSFDFFASCILLVEFVFIGPTQKSKISNFCMVLKARIIELFLTYIYYIHI